jgi:murein DD-endopeptidase MepM/ murein hydrolase activator NlpD
LPDPRRLYRRVTESQLPVRVLAHLSVLTLVAAASIAGLGQVQQPDGTAGTDGGFGTLIQSVRGAGNSFVPETTIHDLGVDAPLGESGDLDRSVHAQVPSTPTPLPQPLAIDPEATPLPAPESGPSVGGTAVGGGTTSRVPAPAPASTSLVWPVPVGSISQYYHSGHLALDIAASYGSTVVAAQSGTVTWAGWRNNGGGNVISIDHGNGMTTVYNHLGSVWVSPGQVVGAGQGIGGVGCTGICTGPHVHFEVIVNGIIDNPLRYF